MAEYTPQMKTRIFKQPDIFIHYKTGFLNVMGTTMHEFGHYVHRKHPEHDAAIKRLFLEEIDGVSALSKRTYCQTSEREFFAEAFKAYFTYSRESLLEMAPGTTQIIDDILALYMEGSE